jgi:hypothetical protein
MSIQFYKPNKSNKGFAASFQDSHQNDCVFVQIIKQSGWDDTKHIGSFATSRTDITANTTIKINDLEAAALLDVIERNRPFTAFHDSDSPKSVSFVPWISKTPPEEGQKPEQRGFSFFITIGSKTDSDYKNAFYIGFSYAEARLIREFLINTLHSHFNIARQEAQNSAMTKKALNVKPIVPQETEDKEIF